MQVSNKREGQVRLITAVQVRSGKQSGGQVRLIYGVQVRVCKLIGGPSAIDNITKTLCSGMVRG